MNFKSKLYDTVSSKVMAFAKHGTPKITLAHSEGLELLSELQDCSWTPNEKHALLKALEREDPSFLNNRSIYGVETVVV